MLKHDPLMTQALTKFKGVTFDMLSMATLFSEKPEDKTKLEFVQTAWREATKAGIIEWCCPGRHGAIRNVLPDQWKLVQAVVEWHFGGKSCHWRKGVKVGGVQLWNVEFVHMTKTSPAPKQPWNWCGKTILFADLKERELANQQAAQKFKIGDTVEFNYKGYHKGTVTNVGKRVTIVIPGFEGKYYIVAGDPKTNLRHAKEAL